MSEDKKVIFSMSGVSKVIPSGKQILKNVPSAFKADYLEKKVAGSAGKNWSLRICKCASCQGSTRLLRFEKSGSAGNVLVQAVAVIASASSAG